MSARRVAAVVAAAALSVPVSTMTSIVVASSAEAAPKGYYSSCAKLTKKYPHGVAKGAAAAAYQVDQGYGRPATSKKAKKVYKVNRSRLDRDGDGTACEG